MMFRHTISIILLAFFLSIASSRADSPQGVDLAALDGWDIVVSAQAIESETYAAEQLQQFLNESAGRKLPIRQEVNGSSHHIFVGESKAMRDTTVGFAVADMGEEELRIVIRDGNIAIAGGRPRGALYGVYTFLEDYLGVRFLTPDATHVPSVGTQHVVGPVDFRYQPPLSFRWSFYGEINQNPVFASRMRCNTVPRDAKFGGVTRRQLISHTFTHQIPTTRYGAEHPEYFALRDGKRLSQVVNEMRHTQPCVSNPDVQRIVTDSVLADIAAHPEWGNVSVSQNDNGRYCQCEKCAALDAAAESHMGAQLSLVNAVADEVAKRHPGVAVGTLAYQYTRKPPKGMQPRPNVQIQLCSIECSQIYPIDDARSKLNVPFCEDLIGWGKLCDDICVWTYNTNFHDYLLPCPNLQNIEPNIRLFVAHHARGIFMQGPGNAEGGDFCGLRNYMTSRLLWNPSLKGDVLMDEFLHLYYGPAAPPIRRFLDQLAENARAKGADRNCFGLPKHYGMDEATGKAALDMIAEANSLAQNDLQRERIEKASIWAYRTAVGDLPLQMAGGMHDRWKRGELPLENVATMSQADIDRKLPFMRNLLTLCKKHHVTMWAEEWPMEDVLPLLRKFFGLKPDEDFVVAGQ
jgi:hypothetical protein